MTESTQGRTGSAPPQPGPDEPLRWGSGPFMLTLSISPGAPAGILALDPAGTSAPAEPGAGSLPLVEVLSVSEGRSRSSQRYTETAIGSRLRYLGHRTHSHGIWNTLELTQGDPATGLTAVSHLKAGAGSAALQSSVTLTNHGSAPIHLQAVTSMAFPVLKGPKPARAEDLRLFSGSSQWLGENQWSSEPLPYAKPSTPASSRPRPAARSRLLWR